METITFGGTGLRATPVGFGGAPFALLGTPAAETDTLLGALLDVGVGLLDVGVGLLDTAAGYGGGDSEEAIGRAISGRRDEYTLVSKCGHRVDDGDAEAWSPALIASSIDRSLRRMRTDRVDVMLLHSCELEVLERGEVFEALRRARDAGKIRCFGYSGDNEAAVYAAGHPDVAVIETSISIADQCNIDDVLVTARERNLGVLGKRPIANAAWKQAEQQPGFYGDYASTYHGRLAAMGVTPADLGYDGEPAAVWPEIALRFTLAQPGVHSAIVGTTNPAHVKANIAAAEKGPLPDDQVAALRSAFAAAESAAGEAWTGQT